MTPIDDSARRLVLEAGFAAVNHGLAAPAAVVLDALPWLVPQEAPRALSRALLLYGIGRGDEALALLSARDEDAARELGRLLRAGQRRGGGE
jgi:type III secretion system SsaH family protein